MYDNIIIPSLFSLSLQEKIGGEKRERTVQKIALCNSSNESSFENFATVFPILHSLLIRTLIEK